MCSSAIGLAGLPARVRALEDEVATQKEELTSHKEKLTSHKEELTSLKIKVGSLEDRVSSLTMSQGAYKLPRNRFISKFKRDKLGNATDADMKIIGAGNAWARGGDAGVDAMLHQSQGSDRGATLLLINDCTECTLRLC